MLARGGGMSDKPLRPLSQAGEGPCSQSSGGGRDKRQPSWLPEGAPELCGGNTSCSQPEAQRGEVACLRLLSRHGNQDNLLSFCLLSSGSC